MDLQETFPSLSSRENFLRGLAMLATADGVVDETEKVYFINAAGALGLPQESIDAIVAIFCISPIERTRIDISFESPKESLSFVKEAIQLCYLDGVYCDNERKYIEDFARLNKLTRESIEAIEAWVIEGIEWSRRGEELITKLEGV